MLEANISHWEKSNKTELLVMTVFIFTTVFSLNPSLSPPSLISFRATELEMLLC